jgi:hypothetical protein
MMFKALALASLVVSAAAAAPAEARGITYDCDTAAGHYSELVLPAPGARFSVSGNIKVNAIAKDTKWAPLLRVRIGPVPAAPGASQSAYAGLTLTALPGKAVSLAADTIQMFSFDATGVEDMIASSLQSTGAVQPFRLSFDGRSVAVAVGAEMRSFPLSASEPVVQITCSTGEFLLTDLRLEATN